VVAEVATGLTGAVPGHAAPGTKNPTRSAALDGPRDVPARRVGADRAGRARRRRAVRRIRGVSRRTGGVRAAAGGARPGPARALLRRTRARPVLASRGAGAPRRGHE